MLKKTKTSLETFVPAYWHFLVVVAIRSASMIVIMIMLMVIIMMVLKIMIMIKIMVAITIAMTLVVLVLFSIFRTAATSRAVVFSMLGCHFNGACCTSYFNGS